MKKYFRAPLLILLVLLASFTVYKLLSKNSLAQTGSASIGLSFTPAAVTVGQSTSLSVTVNAGTNKIIASDIALSYPPNQMNVTGITPNTSSNFKTFAPLNSAGTAFDWTKAVNSAQSTIEFGAVSYNLSAGLTTPPNTGTVSVGTVAFTARPVRRDVNTQVSVRYQSGSTTDANIVRQTTYDDILAQGGSATVRIQAEPVCRAAVDISDQSPGLNDLLYVIAKPWNGACSGCLEDLDGNGTIGLGDLLYVTGYWGQSCSVSG